MSSPPITAEEHKARAMELRKQNKLAEALEELNQALKLKPDFPAAYFNIASILLSQRRAADAAAAWRKAIELKPDYYQAHSALGMALRRMGKHDQAIAACERAVEINPSDIDSRLNLANAMADGQRLHDAAAEYERILQLDPTNGRALNNYANLLAETDQHGRAVDLYRAAMQHNPRLVASLLNLGGTLTAQGNVSEALRCYHQVLEHMPGSWEAHSNLLLTLNYDPRSDRGLYPAHADWAKRHAARFYPQDPPVFSNSPDPERRLRVGYVSADFRRHSVSYFFEPILTHHDRSQVEVFCYSNVARPDEVTRRFEQKADHWRNIAGESDDQAAHLIRQDKIDILVDLSGHTAHHRLLVFARKPAPIQITYLGYPNTTGLRTMDYRIGDAQSDPEGVADQLYNERLMRLPHGMWCYQPPENAPPPRDLSTTLPDAPVVFGTFNLMAKINSYVKRAWALILQAVPNSTLLIKAESLGDPEMRQALRSIFVEHNADPGRVEAMGREPSFVKHLQTYHQLDIALDTFPYNGTTTTCEALWMGVPVITLAGNAHLSRVGASLLSRIGLEDLVAGNAEDYVRIAVDLATDVQRRRAISGMNLRNRMKESPLMDGPGFAHDLEDAYRQAWREWCAA